MQNYMLVLKVVFALSHIAHACSIFQTPAARIMLTQSPKIKVKIKGRATLRIIGVTMTSHFASKNILLSPQFQYLTTVLPHGWHRLDIECKGVLSIGVKRLLSNIEIGAKVGYSY